MQFWAALWTVVFVHLRVRFLLLPWGSLAIEPRLLSFERPNSLASAAERAQFSADHQIWLPPVAVLLEALEVVSVT